jgi:predicted DCC family thiol-disulfide oxidoreductase YuxK
MTEKSQKYGPISVQTDNCRRFLVIYDGSCPICRASVKFLKKMDFLREYSYLTLQEYNGKPGSKIPVEFLLESIHVIDSKNSGIYPGMKGISRLMLHSPPSFPIYLLIMLLRLLTIADPLYKWISVSRYVLSRQFLDQ